MTLRERYRRYYTAQGFVPYPTRSSKYIALEKPGSSLYIFLGKSGGVRRSTTPAVSKSVSIQSEAFLFRLRQFETENGLQP